ncbi:response regulator [Roseovarius salinarum]|uniref:response regulator n=1 Tax=Roseovarius salinarum TaxID=1981892 RepID=UPI000C31F6EA|nr:response regulator [Roseovarius salinarum]
MRELNRILHVEDDPDILKIAKMSLEMVGGFALAQYERGQEAIESAEAFAPDLVLLDVMMPDLDGEETMVRLRAIDTLAQTPVVFMTAKASQENHERLRSLGALDVIVKPFDPMALPDQLKEIWRRQADA